MSKEVSKKFKKLDRQLEALHAQIAALDIVRERLVQNSLDLNEDERLVEEFLTMQLLAARHQLYNIYTKKMEQRGDMFVRLMRESLHMPDKAEPFECMDDIFGDDDPPEND